MLGRASRCGAAKRCIAPKTWKGIATDSSDELNQETRQRVSRGADRSFHEVPPIAAPLSARPSGGPAMVLPLFLRFACLASNGVSLPGRHWPSSHRPAVALDGRSGIHACAIGSVRGGAQEPSLRAQVSDPVSSGSSSFGSVGSSSRRFLALSAISVVA